MENQKETSKIMFELLRFEICGQELSAETKEGLSSETLKQLYLLSKRHDLAHLLADALDRNGLLQAHKELAEKFETQRQLAVYRYEQMQYEFERICAVLEEAKIAYMPLKGAVIRDYYPEPWMRTSCDIDILVKEEYLSAAIALLEKDLKCKQSGGCKHDVSLYTESNVHVELHYELIEEEYYADVANVLNGVWSTAKTAEGKSCEYIMSNEMFYFYHIAHMAKHFGVGGCGVRPFIDIWLLEHIATGDKERRKILLEKGGLFTFATAVKKLTEHWLAEVEKDELIAQMQSFILRGGSYGNLENWVELQIKEHGKIKSFWICLFPPYRELRWKYPVLQKHKWLYPFMLFRRWFSALFKKGKVKKTFKELGEIVKQEKTDEADLLKELGLRNK